MTDPRFDIENTELLSQDDILIRLQDMGLDLVIRHIFKYLDCKSIANAESVSRSWNDIITSSKIWEDFVKAKIAADPLWRRIYNLLKKDEAVCPDERSVSFKQVPKAIYTSCKFLETSWHDDEEDKITIVEDYVIKNEIVCDSVDEYAAQHFVTDDDYFALKNAEGVVKIWSRKTYQLETELTSTPEPPNSYGTYAIGDKLFLCSGLDGKISVWDLLTNKIIFEIQDVQGEKIISLNFNPYAGILMASSSNYLGKSKSSPLLTQWKASKSQRGNFQLKQQFLLSNISVLKILGWEARTFGILCVTTETELKMVQIYAHNKTFNLLCVIPLEEKYQLDWADGYLVILHRYSFKLYDVTTGTCLQTFHGKEGENELPRDFFRCCTHVGVCSSKIVAAAITNDPEILEDVDDYENDPPSSFYEYSITERFFEPVKKNFTLEEKCFMGLAIYDTGKSASPDFRIKVSEIQILSASVYIRPFDGSRVCCFNLLDIFPSCSYCGLYKRCLPNAPDASFSAARCQLECGSVMYCSELCRDIHWNSHKCHLKQAVFQ